MKAVILIILFFFSNSTLANVNVTLSWLKKDTTEFELSWPRSLKWVWAKNSENKWQPYLEVWIEVPEHLEFENLPEQKTKFLKRGDLNFLIIEVHSHSRTLSLNQLLPEKERIGISINVMNLKPTIVLNENCKNLIKISSQHLNLQLKKIPFLYLGAFCKNPREIEIITTNFAKVKNDMVKANANSLVIDLGRNNQDRFYLYDENDNLVSQYSIELKNRTKPLEQRPSKEKDHLIIGTNWTSMSTNTLGTTEGHQYISGTFNYKIISKRGSQYSVISHLPFFAVDDNNSNKNIANLRVLHTLKHLNSPELSIGVNLTDHHIADNHPLRAGITTRLQWHNSNKYYFATTLDTFTSSSSFSSRGFQLEYSFGSKLQNTKNLMWQVTFATGGLSSEQDTVKYSQLILGALWNLNI